ncbi:MAG: hypothetical protein Q4B57_10635, partial [Eubacteriales bacterium]|nr:hypothetical protein [Eubacteriales bacterium]
MTEGVSEYDREAKQLIANRKIIGMLLAAFVDEFQGMTAEEAEAYIVEEPLIGSVPLDSGMTNTVNTEGIVIYNTENSAHLEGEIKYDILFRVWMRGEISQFIINLEIQKNMPTEYPLLNRGIFYGARMLSSEKERDFVKMEYGKMKRAYSIWLCMNLKECSTYHVQLQGENRLGTQQWEGDLGLMQLTFVGLPKTLPDKKESGIHRLLTGILSNKISAEKKLELLNEFGLQTDKDIKERVNYMCNLGEGI